MSYNKKFSKLFFSDIDSTLGYISDNLGNAAAARKMYAAIKYEIERIILMPFSYPDCSYWYFTDIRFRHCPIGNYSIFFRIDESTKTIYYLRFLYSKMEICSDDITV